MCIEVKGESENSLAMNSQKGGEGGGRCIDLCNLNLGTRWRWVSNATSRPLAPQERFPVPIVQEEALGSVWTVWRTGNILPTPRFDPRAIQPVVNRYTDYAIPALFISGLPRPNLIENAPLVGVV